jgi:TRAP-type C4-dicarboxylate transport system substrate-binding protein
MVKSLCCIVLGLTLLPAAARGETIKLKFADFAPDTEIVYVAAIKPFIAAVNQEAKGIIEIEAFPNGALGRNLPQQAQMVLDGVADFAFIIPGATPGRFADNNLMELPGLFQDARDSTLAYNTLVNAGRLRGYEPYFVVAALGTPPSSIHTRARVATVNDLKGRKIRATNAMEARAVKALGAATVLMPVTEAGEAIARGTIDGTTMYSVPLVDFGLAQVANQHYVANIGISPLAVVMSKEKFDQLPAAGQEAIRKYSGAWFTDRYIAAASAANDKAMKSFADNAKAKVVSPTAADRERLAAAYRSVVEQWAAEAPHNAELLDALQTELAKIRVAN